MYYYINRNTKSMLKASDNYSKPGDNILIGEYETKEEFIDDLELQTKSIVELNESMSEELSILIPGSGWDMYSNDISNKNILHWLFIHHHDLKIQLEKQYRESNLS